LPPEAASDCVFCRIVEGNLPSTEVARTDGFLAIEDIDPKADVHLLVLPERHVADFRGIGAFDAEESKRLLEFIAETARTAGLEEYRVMNFCGPSAGQTVFHLHFHVLGGQFRGLPA
jgi:histidine triad (HIT) family protein